MGPTIDAVAEEVIAQARRACGEGVDQAVVRRRASVEPTGAIAIYGRHSAKHEAPAPRPALCATRAAVLLKRG